MSKSAQNIVHEYFKREFEDFLILVQLNPVNNTGVEITIPKSDPKNIQKRALEFDENIYEDLEVDEFVKSSALEFNLYYKGLVG